LRKQAIARIVLLKAYIEMSKFFSFTNYESRKGQELATQSAATCLFFGKALDVSVRMRRHQKDSDQASDDNYQSRPLRFCLFAWASQHKANVKL